MRITSTSQTAGQAHSRKTNALLWTIQGLLALTFLVAGGMKLAMPAATLAQNSPLRLTEIAEATSLNKATTLRILVSLIEEGFVSRVAGAKTVIPGLIDTHAHVEMAGLLNYTVSFDGVPQIIFRDTNYDSVAPFTILVLLVATSVYMKFNWYDRLEKAT